MKRVSLVVMNKHREDSLHKLRNVGLLHLEEKNVSSETLTALLEEQAQIEKAKGILEPYKSRAILQKIDILHKHVAPHKRAADAEGELFSDEGVPLSADAPERPAGQRLSLSAHIAGLEERQRSLLELEASVAKEQARIQGWGNFSPRDIRFLARNGVHLYLYEFAPGALRYISSDVSYLVINKTRDTAYIVSLGMEIPGETPVSPGRQSLEELTYQLQEIRKELSEIDSQFLSLYFRDHVLDGELINVMERIEFESAHAGMESLGSEIFGPVISWVTGFVPAEDALPVRQVAVDNGWAYAISDPSPTDLPPTIMRNKSLAQIIQPLFRLLGTLPGYWEYDISILYMLFFCIFFAMIFGDGGYGLIFFGGTIAAFFITKLKTGRVPDLVKLFFFLSIFTVFWGAITGAWFAVPHANLPPLLRSFIIPPFNNQGPVSEFPAILQQIFELPAAVPTDELKTRWYIQFLCFTIALVQLITARTYLLAKLLPSLEAFAQVGMILMIGGIYFFVLSLLLAIPLPSFVLPFVIAGVALNFIFSEQKGGNFFVNISKSFSNFFSIFLKVVSCFSDIISYIRLFAVGLAGSLIGKTVNTIALSSGGISEGLAGFTMDFFLKLTGTALILIFGHLLNILMGSLSLVVHGIRLNLLEFAGNHLGMEWSGYDYKPFALKHKEAVS
ncbi:MAG: hypothetical protein FWH12_04755 [Treponema sp.]|nr:hypothetical protein [Treponema sp.]